MVANLLMVALGGALGASARYLAGIGILRLVGHTALPLGILAVNVVGSFLMGVFITLAAQRGLIHLSPLVATGFLGGFTTFSSFSLETVTLWERGDTGLATLYVVLSVGVSVAALSAGILVSRWVTA